MEAPSSAGGSHATTAVAARKAPAGLRCGTPPSMLSQLLPTPHPWIATHALLPATLHDRDRSPEKYAGGTSRPTGLLRGALLVRLPHYAGSGRGEAKGRNHHREPVPRGTVLRGGEGGAGARREGNPGSDPGGDERRGLGPESAEGKPPSTAPAGPETGAACPTSLRPALAATARVSGLRPKAVQDGDRAPTGLRDRAGSFSGAAGAGPQGGIRVVPIPTPRPRGGGARGRSSRSPTSQERRTSPVQRSRGARRRRSRRAGSPEGTGASLLAPGPDGEPASRSFRAAAGRRFAWRSGSEKHRLDSFRAFRHSGRRR